MLAFVQPHSKTLGDGTGTRGCLRHKDALLCAQSALARYLIMRFTLGSEQFPAPCSADLTTLPLFPGRDKDRSISYAGHNRRIKELFKRLDIFIEKRTHAARVFAARKADEAGLSDEVGSWGNRMRGSGVRWESLAGSF